MDNLPTIKLDTTLAELYQRASPEHATKRYGHMYAPNNAMFRISPGCDRITKYIYQDSAFQDYLKEELTEQNKHLRRWLQTKYLNIVPQRDAFITGDTTAVFFHSDHDDEQINHDSHAAETTFSVLDSSQRPQLLFCPGPAQIPVEKARIDLLTCKLVLDSLDQCPMAVPPEVQFWVNTKTALVQSGLPTPKCDIIQLDGYNSIPIDSCCDACRVEEDAAHYIPVTCTGTRSQWLADQITRITSVIEQYPLPFVFKHQQSFGGTGVYLIRSNSEREKLIQSNKDRKIFRKLFSLVNASNHQFELGDIILSELIEEPVSDTGVTFFVTDSGEYIFMGACDQVIENDSRWTGNTINYAQQAELEQKFAPLMQKIASWLHRQGYYGPVGADILEVVRHHANGDVADGDNNTNDTDLLIVDLNVRTTGSMSLTLLSNHFYKARGLQWAASFNVKAKGLSRSEFIAKWAENFRSGRMVLLSWYQDRWTGDSVGDGLVGAENREDLILALKKVREGMERVRF